MTPFESFQFIEREPVCTDLSLTLKIKSFIQPVRVPAESSPLKFLHTLLSTSGLDPLTSCLIFLKIRTVLLFEQELELPLRLSRFLKFVRDVSPSVRPVFLVLLRVRLVPKRIDVSQADGRGSVVA